MEARNLKRLAQLADADRAGIREERERVRGLSPDQGLAEALSLAALTVAEIARRVGGDDAALWRILGDQGPSFDLRARWNALHPAKGGA